MQYYCTLKECSNLDIGLPLVFEVELVDAFLGGDGEDHHLFPVPTMERGVGECGILHGTESQSHLWHHIRGTGITFNWNR